MNLFRIAWRNLWRNKRRTLITISSVLFGVFFASMLYSLEEGSYGNMIDNVVKFFTGYLNIQQKDFQKTRSLNDSFIPDKRLLSALQNTKEITLTASRLESVALASSGEKSFPVMVMGIEPDKEEAISGISRWIKKGRFLKSRDPGVIIGSVLASNLNISCGDTLILISQGYHGVSAAGKYPVTGIALLPSPELNRQLVYMGLPACQTFYSIKDKVTSLMIMLHNYSEVQDVKEKLDPILPADLHLYTWQDLNQELIQFIAGKKSSGNIYLGILFMIIGFGILGTLIMLLAERKRELGVMMALGMKRFKLSLMIFLETVYIGLMGIAAGFLVTYPLILYFVYHPIQITGNMRDTFIQMGFEPVISFSPKTEAFYNPAIIVFIITLFVSSYVFYAVYRLKETEAITG